MAGKAGRRGGKLTARRVKTARKIGLLGDGNGLYLKIDPGGSKSWVFRFQVRGKPRRHGLGPIHAVSLSNARKRAETVRNQLLDGVDPIEARRAAEIAAAVAEARSITFDEAVAKYIKAHKAGWKSDKHHKQWQSTLSTYASPIFGKLAVSAVDTNMVLQVLEPIWLAKAETAHRVRGRIEAVLDWAKAKHYRSGDNPALWRGGLKHLLPARGKVSKVKHHAALPYAEIAAFMGELRGRDGIAPRALEFTILTAARSGEVLGARWDEIDIAAREWTVPAERMKGGVKHIVPLSDRALAVIEQMRAVKCSGFIFPGAKRDKPMSNMAMTLTLRRMKYGHVTVHGFRSCFRDWSTEVAKVREVVGEAALAHGVKDKTEAAYRRATYLDERGGLMQRWAAFCDRRVSSGKVVALR
jgi:integrase